MKEVLRRKGACPVMGGLLFWKSLRNDISQKTGKKEEEEGMTDVKRREKLWRKKRHRMGSYGDHNSNDRKSSPNSAMFYTRTLEAVVLPEEGEGRCHYWTGGRKIKATRRCKSVGLLANGLCSSCWDKGREATLLQNDISYDTLELSQF